MLRIRKNVNPEDRSTTRSAVLKGVPQSLKTLLIIFSAGKTIPSVARPVSKLHLSVTVEYDIFSFKRKHNHKSLFYPATEVNGRLAFSNIAFFIFFRKLDAWLCASSVMLTHKGLKLGAMCIHTCPTELISFIIA